MYQKTARVILFIDADNISPKYADDIIKEACSFGEVDIRYAFGQKVKLKGWREAIVKHDITRKEAPIGKDNTDKLIASKAAELATGAVDIFCLVSNDGGFLRTAEQLRSWGKQVVIMGNKHAAKVLKEQCQFIEINHQKKPQPQNTASNETKKKLINMLQKAFATNAQEWLYLGVLGNLLKTEDPTFTAKKYGSSSLSRLLQTLSDYVELRDHHARLKIQH